MAISRNRLVKYLKARNRTIANLVLTEPKAGPAEPIRTLSVGSQAIVRATRFSKDEINRAFAAARMKVGQ